MLDEIKELEKRALSSIRATEDLEALHALKVKFLGKKGELTAILKGMAKLTSDERPKVGQEANRVKQSLSEVLKKRGGEIQSAELKQRLEKEAIDVTLSAGLYQAGAMHPLTQVNQQICDIFHGLGFAVETGPEVESDYYNFTALNFPEDHPARDMQDTFFVEGGYLLRTHTSPVQIRTMEKRKPPLKIVVPGKVYRHDADVTHSPMFHQIEGLAIDKDTTMADLKGVLVRFLRELFGQQTKVRFRPSFFPFTEPSVEVDMYGAHGWMEILGAGMVHPAVLENVGYDSEVYQGFAFGLGIERIAMILHNITDIRLFYEGSQPFLRQFV